MNETPRAPSSQKFEIALLLLFILVYLCGFTALRLVRDDWSSISNFARGMQSNPFGFVMDVITNRWLGLNQSRIFFFSWLLQIGVGFFGRFNYVPYYLFILTWHLVTSILLFSILRKHLQAPAMAAVLSCVYLVAPANTNVLFWLNNWFFSIPVFFLVLQIYFLTFPRKSTVYQVSLLSLVTICGQFSGEQAIAMFYLSFAIFALHALFTAQGKLRSKEFLQASTSALLSALALTIYIKWVMDYSVTENAVEYSLENVRVYTWHFFNYFRQTLITSSEFYGFDSLPFGTKTIFLIVLETLVVAIIFIWLTSRSEWQMPTRRALIVGGALILYTLAALAPCLYGALTGIRPGVSWRYLFVATFPILGSFILLFGIVFNFSPRRWRHYILVPLSIFVIYLSALTTYTLNRVWKFQKGIDEKIWSQIDAVILPTHNSIVTVNLSEKQAQLVPHYASQAISDFQADWGVSQRLWPTQQRMIGIGQRVEELPGSDNLKVVGYYTGSEWEAPRDSVLFVTYKYGPKYSDLKDARLNVFAKYADFKRFIEANPRPQ